MTAAERIAELTKLARATDIAERVVAEWRHDFEGAYCSGVNSELVKAIAAAVAAQQERTAAAEAKLTEAMQNACDAAHGRDAAVAAERERCAKVADMSADHCKRSDLFTAEAACRGVAAAIRAATPEDRDG